MRSLVLIISLIAGAALLLLCGGCDEKKFIEKAKDSLADAALNALTDAAADPEILLAYQEGGFDAVIDRGPSIYLRYLKNNVTELGLGDEEIERGVYDWAMKNWPLVAKMAYRTGPAGDEGLWPRLIAWQQTQGLERGLAGLRKLNESQLAWLKPRAVAAIVEEYNTVMALEAADSQAIREDGITVEPGE